MYRVCHPIPTEFIKINIVLEFIRWYSLVEKFKCTRELYTIYVIHRNFSLLTRILIWNYIRIAYKCDTNLYRLSWKNPWETFHRVYNHLIIAASDISPLLRDPSLNRCYDSSRRHRTGTLLRDTHLLYSPNFSSGKLGEVPSAGSKKKAVAAGKFQAA